MLLKNTIKVFEPNEYQYGFGIPCRYLYKVASVQFCQSKELL